MKVPSFGLKILRTIIKQVKIEGYSLNILLPPG